MFVIKLINVLVKYKISNEEGRVYIGSTFSLEERWAQHRASQETDKFHTEMRRNPDACKFEKIQEVVFTDIETLLIAETTQIMKYNSIANGFNSKFPINITNIY